MSRYVGKRVSVAAATSRPGTRRRLLMLAGGVTVTLVAWGVLVFSAIGFGTDAREGAASSWWLVALTSAGAALCLFVALLLGGRLVALLSTTDVEPPRQRGPRVPPRRRATR